jgi:hypothetical protein
MKLFLDHETYISKRFDAPLSVAEYAPFYFLRRWQNVAPCGPPYETRSTKRCLALRNMHCSGALARDRAEDQIWDQTQISGRVTC